MRVLHSANHCGHLWTVRTTGLWGKLLSPPAVPDLHPRPLHLTGSGEMHAVTRPQNWCCWSRPDGSEVGDLRTIGVSDRRDRDGVFMDVKLDVECVRLIHG